MACAASLGWRSCLAIMALMGGRLIRLRDGASVPPESPYGPADDARCYLRHRGQADLLPVPLVEPLIAERPVFSRHRTCGLGSSRWPPGEQTDLGTGPDLNQPGPEPGVPGPQHRRNGQGVIKMVGRKPSDHGKY